MHINDMIYMYISCVPDYHESVYMMQCSYRYYMYIGMLYTVLSGIIYILWVSYTLYYRVYAVGMLYTITGYKLGKLYTVYNITGYIIL